MSDIQAAGAICYLREKKKTLFLLLRSSKHGEWGPPKGHAEEGESDVETASRELFEEAGIRRARFVPGFRESIAYRVEKKGSLRDKEVVFFLCEIDSDQVEISHEHTDSQMATIAEVETLIQHEDLKDVFRKALEFVTGK